MESDNYTDNRLSAQGVFIDDLYHLRILEPASADESQRFKEECSNFIQSIRHFENAIENFRHQALAMAAVVEHEKQRAIGLRLSLESVVKKKEEDKRRLLIAIDERRMELEGLRLELEMIEKAGHFHQETIDHFQTLN